MNCVAWFAWAKSTTNLPCLTALAADQTLAPEFFKSILERLFHKDSQQVWTNQIFYQQIFHREPSYWPRFALFSDQPLRKTRAAALHWRMCAEVLSALYFDWCSKPSDPYLPWLSGLPSLGFVSRDTA